MNTAVIINLDYEAQSVVRCRQLWKMIERRMAAADFVQDSRRFVTALGIDQACQQARKVMDSVEADYKAKGLDAAAYIRDFYAVPCSQMVDLAGPVQQSVEVDLMETGAFQKFFV